MKKFKLLTFAITALMSAVSMAKSVEHSMGTTEVPDNPKRVVILTNEGTEALLALGVTPVGAANSWNGDPWYPHLMEKMQSVTPIGTENAINLEALAALQPDIILCNKQRQEKIYSHLSAIAPTVCSDRLRGDWQVNFKLYAEALGLTDKGQQVLTSYQANVKRLSASLGESLKQEISVIRFLPSQIRIYQKDSFSGVVLSQLGFARPEIQNVDKFAIKTGKESIPDMDGDRIFYFTWDSGDGKGHSAANDVLNDPLWKQLSAVKAGKLDEVSDTIWNTSGGVLSANLMLKDVANFYNVDF